MNKFEGIVLKARDYGESNQILTVFTRHQGKIAIMARGSKKTRSRFGAVTEPFTQAHFVTFGTGNIVTLSQADLIKSHHLLRSDLLLTAYGAYWVELIDKTTEDKEPHPPLYEMLVLLLNRLEQETDPDILTFILELRILKMAGYTPVLDRCVSCHAGQRPVRFSIRQGGFLCENCQAQDPKAIPVSNASVRILRILLHVDLRRLGEVKIRQETRQQLEKVIRSFIDEYLPVRLKSLHLLKQLKETWT
ncbi:DNA repair protein RecO [Thermoactinomyces mirandus]|uniref:DNA repair protein RecO n=1 Tax=Thermoactinomyces mirandus TaxID=2756294 RepID=UPI0015EF9D31|nr:DNA repair protein RecO [Thermoactinomyces mirandus]